MAFQSINILDNSTIYDGIVANSTLAFVVIALVVTVLVQFVILFSSELTFILLICTMLRGPQGKFRSRFTRNDKFPHKNCNFPHSSEQTVC